MPTPVQVFRERKRRERQLFGPTEPGTKSAKLRRAARSAIKTVDLKRIMAVAVKQALDGDKDARRFITSMTRDPNEVDEWVRLNEQLRQKLQEQQARIAELENELATLRR